MKILFALSLSVILVLAYLQVAVAEQPNSSAAGQSENAPAAVPRTKTKRVRADDKAIAADALGSFVSRGHGPSKRQVRIDALHTIVAERAQNDPSRTNSATLVFRTGLTVPELVALTESHGLEVMAFDVKTPYNDIGVIQTIHIGAEDILKWRGDFATQAEKAIGSYRYRYMQRAEKLESLYGEVTDDSEAYRSMASSQMLIYRCEVFGEARSIKDALVESKIAAVVPDSLDRGVGKIDSYKSRKNETEQRRAEREARASPTG